MRNNTAYCLDNGYVIIRINATMKPFANLHNLLRDAYGTLRQGYILERYTHRRIHMFETAVIQLVGINSLILQNNPEPFNEFSLLDILSCSQHTLQHLNDIRDMESDNNVAHGNNIGGSARVLCGMASCNMYIMCFCIVPLYI